MITFAFLAGIGVGISTSIVLFWILMIRSTGDKKLTDEARREWKELQEIWRKETKDLMDRQFMVLSAIEAAVSREDK